MLDAICYFLIFIFGLCIGSFLNCLIFRVRAKESIMGRSHCRDCQKKFAWYENIPVLSFLFLRGRCKHCEVKISWQYPLVELTTGFLFVAAFYFETQNWSVDLSVLKFNLDFFVALFRDFVLITSLVFIFVYDARFGLILDRSTMPQAVLVFILNLGLGYDWKNLALAGIIGGGFFLAQFVFSRGRWIGGGDIRLGLLMGVALGWPNILLGLFIAYCAGAFFGVALLLRKKAKLKSEIPFGTFLAISTLVTLFFGNQIMDWYLSRLYF